MPSIARGFIILALTTACISAVAGDMTQQEAVQNRGTATSKAYFAAAKILECLSTAKMGKDSTGELNEAKGALSDASGMYAEFLKSNRADSRVPELKDPELHKQLTRVETLLREAGYKAEFQTEGDVARANQEAIERLRKQISDWKNCNVVVKKPSELLKLLENKVFLERTSQVAEATWF